jgi:alpha-L-rhamnosidase
VRIIPNFPFRDQSIAQDIVSSWRGNTVSIPTDCPQRDGRLGWTGDAQLFAPTASLLSNATGFFRDWLNDVRSEQLNDWNGIPPVVVPNVLGPEFQQPIAAWGDVVVLLPWTLYMASGDTRVLSDMYESMTVWIEHSIPRRPNGLCDRDVFQLGDWLDPRSPPEDPASCPTDGQFVADAYLVHVTDLFGRISRVLGKLKEAERYERDHIRLKDAFRKEYMAPSGRLVADTQTGIALAIEFDLFGSLDQREHAAERLAWLVRRERFRVAAGYIGMSIATRIYSPLTKPPGTSVILQALCRTGNLPLAYRMLQEGQSPSWL